MSSCWNENLINFTMELGSTRFDGHIKIRGFRAHQESTLGQTWSKLPKIFEKLRFDVKLWKVIFWRDFYLVWLSDNLGLTMSVLVILAERGTLSALVSERVVPRYSRCSHDLMERRWYFWIFRGLAHKSRANKIWYQQVHFSPTKFKGKFF